MAIANRLHVNFEAMYTIMRISKRLLGEKSMAVLGDLYKYVCRVSNIVV